MPNEKTMQDVQILERARECICGLSSPEKAKPEWHRNSCPAYEPPKVRVPKDLDELETKAFWFDEPEPNWRSESHAEHFARRAAAFHRRELAAARDREGKLREALESIVAEVDGTPFCSYEDRNRIENRDCECCLFTSRLCDIAREALAAAAEQAGGGNNAS